MDQAGFSSEVAKGGVDLHRGDAFRKEMTTQTSPSLASIRAGIGGFTWIYSTNEPPSDIMYTRPTVFRDLGAGQDKPNPLKWQGPHDPDLEAPPRSDMPESSALHPWHSRLSGTITTTTRSQIPPCGLVGAPGDSGSRNHRDSLAAMGTAVPLQWKDEKEPMAPPLKLPNT